MNDIVLTKKELTVLKYIVEYNTNISFYILNRTIPITREDVKELCVKLGIDYNALALYK